MDSERIANLCRICLNQSFLYNNIYDKDSTNSNSNYQVFNFVYGLQIRENDGLPEHVCRECISVVHQFHMYKIKALKSERQLISLKQKMEMMQGVASGADIALEEGQETSATEILIKQEVPAEGEGVKDDAMHSLLDEHTLLQNQIFIKQEVQDECEGVVDDEVGSVLDYHTPLHNQVDVKDEEVTIEEGPPFLEESVFGEVPQGEFMCEEEVSDVFPGSGTCALRREVRRGSRGEEGKERLFKCDHCGERKETKEQVAAHINEAHGFGEEEEKESGHAKSNNEGRRYKCGVCDRGFIRNGDLVRHLHLHTGYKPYKCAVCEKRFTMKYHLNIHMRIHNGNKPYSCSICKMRFSVKWNLNVHMRTHSGDKPFHCTLCKCKFSQNVHLKSHMRTHKK